jgi:hypothetical protein
MSESQLRASILPPQVLEWQVPPQGYNPSTSDPNKPDVYQSIVKLAITAPEIDEDEYHGAEINQPRYSQPGKEDPLSDFYQLLK